MADNRSRIQGIDVAKGIGIILVIFGHLKGQAGILPDYISYLQNLIYQFHVPLFFFLSGMFFRENEDWGAFIKKKLKRLYLPFVISNLVFLVLDEAFRIAAGIQIIPIDEIKHAIKVILMLDLCPMGGATWFLRSLLMCGLLYKLLWSVVRGNNIAVSLICLPISICGMWAPSSFSISATMVAMIFYFMGHLLSGRIISVYRLPLIWRLSVLTICTIALLLAADTNRFDTAFAIYESKVIAIPMAFVGVLFIILLSSFFNEGVFSSIFKKIGKETMILLVGHLATFKIVISIQILAYNLPMDALLSHPCYDVSGCWWVAYFAVGVIVPIIAAFFYDRLERKQRYSIVI